MQKHNLNKGDLVYFTENGNNELMLSPHNGTEQQRVKLQEVSINIDGKTFSDIKRELVSAYIRNSHQITIEGKNLDKKIREIRDYMTNLMALEIVEQTATKLVAKDFLNMKKISLFQTIKKIDAMVRGMLEEPQSFETNAGRMFDYPGYLKARGISAVMQYAKIQNIKEGTPGVLRTLFILKHSFEQALGRVMREPMVSLMKGFLLGEKSGLPQTLTQAFIIAGLIHVVVLSGYNIGVVSEWTLRFFALFLRRRGALTATAVVIVLFALMAGGGMATIRAMLMGLIAILGRYLKRPALALRSLCVAILAMLLWNPLVVFDAGFMLSVLATFGIITLGNRIESWLRWLKEGIVRSTAATTVAAQLFVLPALLYYTGVLSFVSLPANVIFLPFVPLAMLLGFVAGLLALVHPFAALIPALAADALLRAMIWLTEFAASLPLAAAIVPAFPAWVAVAVYIPLCAWAILCYQRSVVQPQTS